MEGDAEVLIIEPFYGGSHKQLIDLVANDLQLKTHVLTLPPKKWKSRLKTSSLYFAQAIKSPHKYTTLFCTSMLNLCELLGMRPDLAPLKKIIYFHEVSALSSDIVLFNSAYNMTSFLESIPTLLGKMCVNNKPITNPKEILAPKCRVLYYPVLPPPPPKPQSPEMETTKANSPTKPLHILWNHRWEWDKRPDLFFNALYSLQDAGLPFVVSVIGEHYEEVPPVFIEAKEKLGDKVLHWGYLPSKEDYFAVLDQADVLVSTTDHEFFGVSVIEGILHGCYPLCPNALVFPEYLAPKHLYNTPQQLLKQLRYLCKHVSGLRKSTESIDLTRFYWQTLKPQYAALFAK